MADQKTIKNKIAALLAKTTENGASEAEALAAMKKAKELMMQYYITENDLKNPFAYERCVFKRVPRVKSGYNPGGFLFELSRLFDCEHYYTAKTVTFFGFEEDTELCAYFYTFIIRACMRAKEDYMKTEGYKTLRTHYHGKTLIASFIKGFIYGISQKMKRMYEDREKDTPQEVGLMVIDKRNKVEQQYKDQNIKVREVDVSSVIREWRAFNTGKVEADKIQLLRGVNEGEQEVKALYN